MKPKVLDILNRVKDTADYGYVDFLDINATNAMGDNALHCVIVWGDYQAAKTLIENGIDINKHGEEGETPLHRACSFGRKDIVELLLEHGADPFSRTEGHLPFTLARFGNYDDICALLSQHMRNRSDESAERRKRHMEGLTKCTEQLERAIGECEKTKSEQ